VEEKKKIGWQYPMEQFNQKQAPQGKLPFISSCAKCRNQKAQPSKKQELVGALFQRKGEGW
jgi:hypothetical protein